MQAGQQIPQNAASSANGHVALHDLFALTDEQILEIDPEPQEAAANGESRAANQRTPLTTGQQTSPNQEHGAAKSAITAEAAASPSSTSHESPVTSHDSAEPPPWLAAQMKDPWSGEEARELWNGVQQAKQEAAAYRAAFATPEDARALKELYPRGVNEARGAAERARQLDEIDHAYFGGVGKSAQEVSASRAQLAQKMLRDDPAAFREMVFAGLRALEESGAQIGADVGSRFSATSAPAESTATQSGTSVAQTQGGLKSAPTDASAQAQGEKQAPDHNARLAAYASFEKAANEDLERSVGGSIERTLAQALPNLDRRDDSATAGARYTAPLHQRLGAAIRQDVEAALKGDRQLGEQVAQILSGQRLDAETRAQVVRLIGERAQQLVPVAAKRVLNDWTQTTLAAHRGRTAGADAASARREVAPASPESRRASQPAGSSASSRRNDSQDPHRSAARSDARRVDYRRLSDEQILEM